MDSNPGFGALFQNNNKAKDTHPDYQGNACCPHCQTQVELAGWKKQSKTGKPYLSLSLKPARRDDGPDDADLAPF